MTLLTHFRDGTGVELLTYYMPILQKDVFYQTSLITSESYPCKKKNTFSTQRSFLCV